MINIITLLDDLKKGIINEKIIKEVNKIFFSFKDIIPSDIDCILVLGCKDGDYRMKKAIEIYKKRNMKIFLSGGNLNKSDETESVYFKNMGLKNKIKERHLIVETKSTNTFENFLYSLSLIKNNFDKEDINILLITSSFHMPRSIKLFEKCKKNNNLNMKIFPLPSYGKNLTPTRWFLNKCSINIIINELDKIKEI